jgi:hypothetical protein
LVKRNDETLMQEWLESLPRNVREALDLTSSLMENFASNVQIAEALNQLCFRRAVDATIDPELSEIDVSMRLAMALKSNTLASKLKRQRLEVLRDFDHVQDVPKPMNVNYTLRLTEVEERIRRLRALGYDAEADRMEQELVQRNLLERTSGKNND